MKTIINIPPDRNCLAVDDSPVRLEWFLKNIPNCKIASSADEAIRMIEAEQFDCIFLDHDAVPVFVPTDEIGYDRLTFWKVAQHLHRNEYNGMVIVHSGNPVGAERMANLLKQYAIVHVLPFGTFTVAQ